MEDEQAADQILTLMNTLVQAIGAEEVIAMLQEAVTMVEQGGEQPPELMSQGGPQAMRPMAPVSYTHLTLPTKRIV